MILLPLTIYTITWEKNTQDQEIRYFLPQHYSDAAFLFAKKVLEFHTDHDVVYAYVNMVGLPDITNPRGQVLASWTKHSVGERMIEGSPSLEALLTEP